MDPKHFAVNADTLNAIITGMGAIIFAVVRQLPPAAQTQMRSDLNRLAQTRKTENDPTGKMLIQEMVRALDAAAPNAKPN